TITASTAGNFTIAGTHTYPLDGRYLIDITVADASDTQSSGTSIAHITRTGSLPSTLATVANALTHSAEHYKKFVTAAYQRYLGRAPDSQGLASWVSAMQNGLTDERLEAGLIGSGEYVTKHGGQGQGWIRGMYVDLLNRTPSTAEINAWLRVLAQGTSPADVAYGFAASAEREGIRVRADYVMYLSRSASPGEVAAWVALFENHAATNEDVVTGFVGSLEFFLGHHDNIGDW